MPLRAELLSGAETALRDRPRSVVGVTVDYLPQGDAGQGQRGFFVAFGYSSPKARKKSYGNPAGTRIKLLVFSDVFEDSRWSCAIVFKIAHDHPYVRRSVRARGASPGKRGWDSRCTTMHEDARSRLSGRRGGSGMFDRRRWRCSAPLAVGNDSAGNADGPEMSEKVRDRRKIAPF